MTAQSAGWVKRYVSLVQSLNSPFFLAPIRAEPGRAPWVKKGEFGNFRGRSAEDPSTLLNLVLSHFFAPLLRSTAYRRLLFSFTHERGIVDVCSQAISQLANLKQTSAVYMSYLIDIPVKKVVILDIISIHRKPS